MNRLSLFAAITPFALGVVTLCCGNRGGDDATSGYRAPQLASARSCRTRSRRGSTTFSSGSTNVSCTPRQCTVTTPPAGAVAKPQTHRDRLHRRDSERGGGTCRASAQLQNVST